MFSHFVTPSSARITVLVLVILFCQVSSHPDCSDSSHGSSLGGRWYQPPSHPVHALFSRQSSNSSLEVFPKVASREWYSMFPETIDPKQDVYIPQAWLDALNKVKTAGLIPPIPLSNVTAGDPIYPNGTDPKSTEVCSSTYEIKSGCRHPDDVWDAPAGRLGISFDDGPLPTSPQLYTFLKSQNQTATHFFIGSNIRQNPKIFLQAFEDNEDDIAVHTYTHPYLTTLSDERIVAELGWTLEIIRVSTGGRISRYFRPPYGDSDNRVRAIARYVFGLTTVLWNKDSLDWELPQGPVTSAGVHKNYTDWYSGPKSPGLIILSHELSTHSIQAFIDTYPLISKNSWLASSIPDLFGGGWYVNAKNSTSPTVNGVQVAENGGAPVWDGYAAETSSLGTTTKLTFSRTATGNLANATVAATQTSNVGASNWATSSRLRLANIYGLFCLMITGTLLLSGVFATII